jgi:hypothetical protein
MRTGSQNLSLLDVFSAEYGTLRGAAFHAKSGWKQSHI